MGPREWEEAVRRGFLEEVNGKGCLRVQCQDSRSVLAVQPHTDIKLLRDPLETVVQERM